MTSSHIDMKARRNNTPSFREQMKDEKEILMELKQQSKSEAPKAQVIFLGDSITEAFTGDDPHSPNGKKVWASEFVAAGWHPVNFAVGGDMTQHLLWRIENGQLDHVNPAVCKVCYLMIGTNNEQDKPEDVASDVGIIIQLLQQRLPNTKILVISVLPGVGDDFKMRGATNKLLSRFHDGARVFYLDASVPFFVGGKVGGKVDSSLFCDGVHFSLKGFDTFVKIIKPHLQQLLVAGATDTGSAAASSAASSSSSSSYAPPEEDDPYQKHEEQDDDHDDDDNNEDEDDDDDGRHHQRTLKGKSKSKSKHDTGNANSRLDLSAPRQQTEEFLEQQKDEEEILNQLRDESQEDAAETQLIFLGDSISEGWTGDDKHPQPQSMWREFESLGWHPINFSVGGDLTQHVIWRLEQGQLEHVNPDTCRVCVLCVGSSNAGMGDPENETPDQIADDVGIIIDLIHEQLPNTTILVLSVLPTTDPSVNEFTSEVNELIHRYHDDNENGGVIHVDRPLLSAFYVGGKVSGGRVDKSLFKKDGVHLSPKGFDVLGKVLQPFIERIVDNSDGGHTSSAKHRYEEKEEGGDDDDQQEEEPPASSSSSSSSSFSSSSSSSSSSMSHLSGASSYWKAKRNQRTSVRSQMSESLRVMKEYQEQQEEEYPLAQVIFIGDSITEAFMGDEPNGSGLTQWKSYFVSAGWHPVLLSIGGNMTQHVVHRLQNGELSRINPAVCKVCYLLIGTNNWEDKVEDVASDIRFICQLVRQQLPQTKILLLSLLPSDDAGARCHNHEVNQLLYDHHDPDGTGVYFLDVWSLFFTDGASNKCQQFDAGKFADGVHLSSAAGGGFDTFCKVVQPKIAELMQGKWSGGAGGRGGVRPPPPPPPHEDDGDEHE